MSDLNDQRLKDIISETVETTLERLGLDVSDADQRAELREDFAHLRKWRKTVHKVEGLSLGVAITTFTSGILAAMVMGWQRMTGNGG